MQIRSVHAVLGEVLRYALACALTMTLSHTSNAAASPADIIFTNGIVRTQDPTHSVAQALAVSGGRIVYVGNDSGAAGLVGPRTRLIDLAGRALLPGLADAHVHPALGEFLNHRLCNVRAFSVEEGLRRLRACEAKAPPGDWVVGYGWYDLDNAEFDAVTRRDLDAISKNRKVVAISKDLHTTWVNSKTLAELGINRATPQPSGGAIVHDSATGEPSGVLLDAAAFPILQRVQHDSPYAVPTTALFRQAITYLNSLGITSIVEALADDDALAAYHELDRAGQLTMHVSAAFGVQPETFAAEIPRLHQLRSKVQSPHLHLDFIKAFGDGNPEVGMTYLLAHGGPVTAATRGYYTDAQASDLVALAEREDFSIFVHVIGDAAARQWLDAVASARRARPQTDLRHTLTHLCWVADEDLPRFRANGVIANIQEGWLAPAAYGGPAGYDYARSTAAGPIGPWLAGHMLPYGPLVGAGARLSAGSDWFYTEENPWYAIEAGATSADPGSVNSRPMLPEHAVSVETLLDALTSGSAYQMHLELQTGTLETGKAADLIVVNQDPLAVPVSRVHDTKVLLTLFEGRIVYEAKP